MTIKEQIETLIITDVKLGLKKSLAKTKEEKSKYIEAYKELNLLGDQYDYIFVKLLKKL